MEEFDFADFVSEERIIPDEKQGKYNLPFILFPTVFSFIFVINYGTAAYLNGLEDFFTLKNMFLIFSAGFLLHELIHFLVWQGLSRYPIEEFRVGMRWNSFTPVIGCQLPMRLLPFRMGLIAPFLLMGLIPIAASFMMANVWLLMAGSIFMAWSSADLLTFILSWPLKQGCFVEMHRNKLGIIAFQPKEKFSEESILND